MREQGSSTLAAGEAGRILDRLAGLEKVIPPELMRQVLLAAGRVNGRACELTHEVMLWIVLAMGLFTNVPIRQVFRYSRRMRGDGKCPARSSLCVGRQRLGVEPLRALHRAGFRGMRGALDFVTAIFFMVARVTPSRLFFSRNLTRSD